MNVPPLQHKIEASDIAPERLASNPQLTEQQKISEATRQFEAILLRQILQDAQKPLLNSKTTDNSTAAGIYRDLVTNQLADSISKSGALGLGKSLEGEFLRRLPHTSAGDDRKAAALPTARPDSGVARPLSAPAPTARHPAAAAQFGAARLLIPHFRDEDARPTEPIIHPAPALTPAKKPLL